MGTSVRAAEAKALGWHSPAWPVCNRPAPEPLVPAEQEGAEPCSSLLHSGHHIFKTFPDSLTCKSSGLGRPLPTEAARFRSCRPRLHPTRVADSVTTRSAHVPLEAATSLWHCVCHSH